MQDIHNNNYEIEDEEMIKEIPKPYKLRKKKLNYKINKVTFTNTKMKVLPNHIAYGIVDNILNPKIHGS